MNSVKAIVFIFFIFTLNARAQHARTFSNYGLLYSPSKTGGTFQISMGESISFGKLPPLRLLAGVNYTTKFYQQGEWTKKDIKNAGLFQLKENTRVSKLNFPIGAELTFKGIGVGISHDIFNFGLKKTLDSGKVSLPPNTEYSQLRFSSIFSGKSKNSLGSTIYVNATINESFSFIFGIISQKSIFNIYKNSKKTDYIGLGEAQPYFSLRFNIEK